MSDSKRRLYLGILKVFNLSLMVAAFGIATVLQVRHGSENITLSAFLSMRIKLLNFAIFCLILLVWHAIFSLCGLYQSQRLASRRSILTDAALAITIATLFLAVAAAALRITMVTSRFLLVFWLCASTLVSGARLLIRASFEFVRARGRSLRYILILGTNHRAVEFARRLVAKPELGYRVLGFVDDAWHERPEPEMRYSLCCGFDGLPEYLRRNVVDEVASYLPLRSFYEHCSRVAALCEQHGIFMRLDPEIFALKIARARTDELDGNAHITAYSFPSDGWPILVKRSLDVMLSLVLLVILAPALVAVALLIRLTSKGPILFRQERMGVNKRRFVMYKFRTMVPNADQMQRDLEAMNEATGPVFKIKNDPRMTQVGRALRRASIDELPQLINVLRGDMSLVGPRPLPVRDFEGFSEDWQRRRFSVRPGITCLWQVKGRNNVRFDQWMRLDLQYLDEWSLWLDIKILARTIPAVMKGAGAA